MSVSVQFSATNGSVDIAVVGGGMAGLRVASAVTGASVAVFESGPDAGLEHNNAVMSADEAVRRWVLPNADPYFRRPWTSATPPHFTGPSGLRSRVGGCSLYWYGVSLPMEDWALTSWPDAARSQLLGDGIGSIRGVLEELSAWSSRDLLDRTPKFNLADLEFSSSPRAVREHGGGRWSAWHPALARRVHAQTEVCELVPSRTGWRVLTADGGSVEASSVVLAAGAVVNAALVSSVGAAPGERRRMNGVEDHITQGVFSVLRGEHARRAADWLPEGSWYAPAPSARSNVFIDVTRLKDELVLDLRCTGEPSSPGWIDTTRGRDGSLSISVAAGLTHADDPVIGAQRELLGLLWRQIVELVGITDHVLDFGEFSSPTRTNEHVLPEHLERLGSGEPSTWASYLGTEDHEGASLRMGVAVDEDLQVIDAPGLYVAGPAVFPRLGAANPTVTSLALATGLAAHLSR